MDGLGQFYVVEGLHGPTVVSETLAGNVVDQADVIVAVAVIVTGKAHTVVGACRKQSVGLYRCERIPAGRAGVVIGQEGTDKYRRSVLVVTRCLPDLPIPVGGNR
jgi:hypothetical protein